MGAYPEAVEFFAPLNLPVIPTRPDRPSAPLVRNPSRLGVPASLELAKEPRFEDANAGIWTGGRSNLTIVDIDSSDPTHLDDAIARFGDSPFKVRTPSGGMHLWFRYGGEGRNVRPFGKNVPIDILGNGLVVVPPSRRPQSEKKPAGKYRIAEGNVLDIRRLPALRIGALPTRGSKLCKLAGTPIGERDNALFRRACALAQDAQTEKALVEAVLRENNSMRTPLENAEAAEKARSAWKYKERGRLFVEGDRAAILTIADISDLAGTPRAMVLLGYLRAYHARDHTFAVVPEAIAPAIQMCPNTARGAREALVQKGYLKCIKRGGLSRSAQIKTPNLYVLG